MDIIWEDLHLSHLACVFLQMTDQLSASNFPNSALTFIASTAYEFAIVTKANGSDSILVSVVDLPERRASFDLKRSDLTVRPTTYYDFICED